MGSRKCPAVSQSQEMREYPAPPDTVCLTLPHPLEPGSKSIFCVRSSSITLAFFPLKTLNSQSQTDFWHASVCLNPLGPELWFCKPRSLSTALTLLSLWCSHGTSLLAKRVTQEGRQWSRNAYSPTREAQQLCLWELDM